jgi:hypothetical protein
MSPETRRLSVWLSIILLVVIIVIIIVFFVINPPMNTVTVFTVEEVVDNPQKYLGENIIVEGYYYHEDFPGGQGVITTTIIGPGTSSTEFIKRLSVNYSDINVTLADQVKYRFTGVLTSYQSGPSTAFILTAIKIDEV